MTDPSGKILPAIDRDSLPFWEGTRVGELRVQRCSGCGAYRWPARAICNRCRSFDAEWVPLSGWGKVVSWVTTHQPFARVFQNDIPYHTVLVELVEQQDLQMLGRLAEGFAPRAKMEVRAIFEPIAEEIMLVYWQPT